MRGKICLFVKSAGTDADIVPGLDGGLSAVPRLLEPHLFSDDGADAGHAGHDLGDGRF